VRTLDSFAEGIRYCEAMLTIFDTKKPKVCPSPFSLSLLIRLADLSGNGRAGQERWAGDGCQEVLSSCVSAAARRRSGFTCSAFIGFVIAYQIWLEWAKQEEELGNYTKAKRIIDRGLEHNPLADGLALRGIKLAERCGDHRGVRRILGRVRTWDTEKSWKAMSEVCAVQRITSPSFNAIL
jgi:hypothetical protein